jgi:ornithine cyclodeaminase/alanine dehydrogenase-like protein (mu-crystallin family)
MYLVTIVGVFNWTRSENARKIAQAIRDGIKTIQRALDDSDIIVSIPTQAYDFNYLNPGFLSRVVHVVKIGENDLTWEDKALLRKGISDMLEEVSRGTVVRYIVNVS